MTISNAINVLTLPRIVAVLLLLVACNVWAPFHADDYFQQLLLRGDTALQRDDASIHGLFSFIDQSAENREQLHRYGVLPWFADPSFYFRFFRPIAELSHHVDATFAPQSAAFAHAHSIVWFVLVCLALSFLLKQQFSAAPTLIVLALAIFAWDGQHVATIHWVANRNALIAAFFAIWALYFFIRVDGKDALNKGLSTLFFVLALLASESAVALIFYLVLYQLLLAEGTKLKRLMALSPFVIVLVLWQFFYRLQGFGADTGQGLYLDPIGDFPEFIIACLQRFPVYFTAALLPMPAGLMWGGGSVLPWLSIAVVVFSWLFMLWVLWCFHPILLADKKLLFWFSAGMLSIVPVCATLAQDRLTLMQTVGVDIAIAMVIYRLLQEPIKSALKRNTLKALVIIHLCLSPLHLLAGSLYMSMAAENIRTNALSFTDEDLAGKTVVALRMPIGESTSLVGIRQFYQHSNPEAFLWLANDEGELSYTWLDDQQLKVVKPEGFGSGHEAAFGRVHQSAYVEGLTITHPAAGIVIGKLTAAGLPCEIILRFNDKNARQTVLLFDYQQGMLRRVDTQ